MKSAQNTLNEKDMIVQVAPVERIKGSRVVRVFVSSSFRDMQVERDELVKYVFPELRKRCLERRVEFSAVDLRWGITAEKVEQKKALPICLAEIDRCRPYFLGILGQYYGHTLDEIDDDLLQRFPWIVSHLGSSMTELEIEHGVLRNPDAARAALFFFRSEEYLDKLSEPERTMWRTKGHYATYLESLKHRIRSLFSSTEYASPKDLRDLVKERLWSIIEADYPLETVPGKLEQERLDHEVYIHRHSRVYIGLKSNFARLDAHALGTGPPLVILGSSGTGKSALLANWVQTWHAKNQNVPLISHFMDASPTAKDPADLLTRLIAEIIEKTGIHYEIPDSPRKLIQAFTDLLHLVTHRSRMILVVDGACKLQHDKYLSELMWLPPEVPANIRLILSTRPGPLAKELKRRRYMFMQLTSLSSKERNVLIREFLARQGRKLTDQNLQKISSASQATSPLFLSVVLEELCVFGVHEKLDERIEYFLQAQTVEDLYYKILERWEADYEHEVEGLVGDIMTLLWASRRGLPERDLLWLLRQNDDELPAHYWSPVYLVADEVLGETSGSLHFSNEHVHQAVQRRYINRKTAIAAHRKISEYYYLWSIVSVTFALSDKYHEFVDSFSDMLRDIYMKQVEELPWQYAQIEAWDDLCTILKDLKFLSAVYAVSASDARRYWTLLTEKGYNILHTYKDPIDHPKKVKSEWLLTIASLLSDLGHKSQALMINKYLSERFRKEKNLAGLGSVLMMQGASLLAIDDLDGAFAVLQEAEHVFGKQHNSFGVASAIHDQGTVLIERGELQMAIRCFNKAKIAFQRERLLRPTGMALNNLGAVFAMEGELIEAMKHLKRAETIHRKVGTITDLGNVLLNQGLAKLFRGNPDDALDQFKEAEALFEKAGEQEKAGECKTHQEVLTLNLDKIHEFFRKSFKK